jgi:hypothetical protein
MGHAILMRMERFCEISQNNVVCGGQTKSYCLHGEERNCRISAPSEPVGINSTQRLWPILCLSDGRHNSSGHSSFPFLNLLGNHDSRTAAVGNGARIQCFLGRL